MFSLALAHASKQAALLLLSLLKLCQVVQLGFSLGLIVKLPHHFVVISLLALFSGLLHEMLIYDGDELLVALVEHLRRNQGHVWLIQEKPVGVFALENGEV